MRLYLIIWDGPKCHPECPRRREDPIHRKEGKLKEEVRNWRGWGPVGHRPGVVPLSPEPPGGGVVLPTPDSGILASRTCSKPVCGHLLKQLQEIIQG